MILHLLWSLYGPRFRLIVLLRNSLTKPFILNYSSPDILAGDPFLNIQIVSSELISFSVFRSYNIFDSEYAVPVHVKQVTV